MIWGVVVATFLLLLPALYNGFPLIFADTLEYVDTGKSIWEGLQGRPQPFYGQRSEFYSLIALPLHREGSNLWPVIVAQAAVTAHLLALCYRSLLPWNGRRFSGLVALLTLLTPAGWTVAWLLPDYTAAGLILAVYLLGPARRQLGRLERVWIGVLLVFFVLCHGANLLLAVGLCLLPGRKFLLLGLGLAIGLQCWIHGRLYGNPSLFAQTPPFLLARWVGDGLVFRYLDQHPESNRFALHPYRHLLKPNSNHFLWSPESAYNQLREHHPEIWERVREQQFSLCLAASRAYPGRQTVILLGNAWTQYVDFSADQLRLGDYPEQHFSNWSPKLAKDFERSRQRLDRLPIAGLNVAFYLTTLTSIWTLWRQRGQRSPLAQRLLWTVMTGTVFNAIITGCLSAPDERYQARVIWLLPLCAFLSWRKQEVVECEGNA